MAMKMARKAAKATTPAPMKAMKKATTAAKTATPKPMKAAMKTDKKTATVLDAPKTATVLDAARAQKAGQGQQGDGDQVSTWIHVSTAGTKSCLIEAWTEANDDVYYKVYKMI